MNKKLFIFLFLIAGLNLSAQNRKKDSLVEKLNSCKQDTQKVKILNKLALLLFSSKQDEARNYTYQALDLAKKTGFKKEEAVSYKVLATINYYNGDFLRAKDLYINALNICIELKDSQQMGNCYRNVGLAAERLMGDRESIQYFFKALKISEERKDSDRTATLYIDIGNAFYTLHDFSKAIRYYRNAYAIQMKKGDEHSVAMALNNIGSVFAETQQLDSGLKYHTMAFEIRKKNNDLEGLVTSYSNMADYYIKSMEYEKALPLNLKCLDVARELTQKSAVAKAMHALMVNYINLKDYKKAEAFGDTARELSLGTGYINTLKEIHLSYYQMYSAMGKPNEALKNYIEFIRYRDSLQNDDVLKRITETQLKFEYEKEKEKVKLEQEAKDTLTIEREKKQEIIRNCFIGGFILLLVLILFVLRSYREKQKANKIITEQKMLVEEKQKEIVDSIRYAQRIQKSLFPTEKYIERILTHKKN
jgi:two-component system, NarL family, sensor kinase